MLGVSSPLTRSSVVLPPLSLLIARRLELLKMGPPLSLLLLAVFLLGASQFDVALSKSCFFCEHVDDPTSCQNYTDCLGSTNMCYVEELLSLDGAVIYNQGCTTQIVCNAAKQGLPPVGKRQSGDGLTTCFRCCDGDDCNAAYCRDNCVSAPCQNNGTCTTTGSNSYNCTCPPGLQGQQCQVDVDECASSPCLYGGTCQDQVNAFQCLCPPGRSGSVCQLDACTSDPCHNNATCQLQGASFTCQCQAGYTGLTCETEVDECASSPCLNGGSCQDLVAGFQCHCGLKWFGERCEVEKNGTVCLECQDLSHPALCRQYTLCQDKDSCFVDQHLSGDGSITFAMGCRSQRVCDLYAHIAGGGGIQGRQSFQITLCSHCCTEDYCNQEYCIEKLNGTACYNCTGVENAEDCHSATVCEGSDQCYVEEYINLNTGHKEQRLGCQTKPFCAATSSIKTRDLDSLPDLEDSQGKLPVERQADTSLTTCFRCCDGDYCNHDACVRDMCESQPCANNGTCSTVQKAFKCTCPPGFVGARCEKVDHCISSPCLHGGTCTLDNSTQGFACSCPAVASGARCEVLDYCRLSPCKNGATCLRNGSPRGFECMCDRGYLGDLCEIVDFCASTPCQHSGDCHNTADGFTCHCRTGFRGPQCQSLDYCQYSLCQNSGSCLLDRIGCKCPPGFTGNHCEISPQPQNPCLHGGSLRTDGSCQCTSGYNGNLCQNRDPCSSSPCQHGATCKLSAGTGYTCSCPTGFKGVVCQAVDVCQPSPCQHGGTCVEKANAATCTCPQGFTGPHCESIVSSPTAPPQCGLLATVKTAGCGSMDEVVFVLEHSRMESSLEFSKELDFVAAMTKAFISGARISAITFGEGVESYMRFTTSQAEVNNYLETMRRTAIISHGSPDLAHALNYTLQRIMLPIIGIRHGGKPTVIAVVHDTHSIDHKAVNQSANALLANCVSLNIIAVETDTHGADQNAFLQSIADLFGAGHLTTLDDFNLLPKLPLQGRCTQS